MKIDYERFKDADGVIDLEAVKRDVWRRQRAATMAFLSVAFLALTLGALIWTAASQRTEGVQGALIGLGMAWVTGCEWAHETRPDGRWGRRAYVLMPLGAIPTLFATVVPLFN